MSEPIKRKKKFSYLSSVLSISMVLLMLGLFGFLVIGGKHMETYLKENMVVNVILQPNISEVEVAQIQQQIQQQPFLKNLVYISFFKLKAIKQYFLQQLIKVLRQRLI